MKYTRFEELPVWQAGMDLVVRTFLMCEDKAFNQKGDIRNQLQRAALSICNNIAEGFERGSTQDLITFLYYARGSTAEVRSIFCLMERLPAFTHLRPEVSELKAVSESISRQLRAWADALQNSDIKGQRYLTEKERKHHEMETRRKVFLTSLKETNAKAAADREAARGQDNLDRRSD